MYNSNSAVSQLQNSPLVDNIKYPPTVWSRADALKVNENDPTTTQPLVSADFPVMSDTVFIWDTMPPLRARRHGGLSQRLVSYHHPDGGPPS
nr:hypothetical protein pPsy0462c_00080 [Pseudomonas syringae]